MVAGKVRMTMGFQKSSSSSSPARANSKQETPQQKSPLPSASSGKSSQKAVFSRSFGVYFPRASAQVQPRPPDVTELLRIVEELRERESRLKTELLEHKLLRETAAIVPALENEIDSKNLEIESNVKKIEELELENSRLKKELEGWKAKVDEERIVNEEKIRAMQEEVVVLKSRCLEYEELSSSQRFQGLVEISGRSNLINSLKRGAKSKYTDIHGGSNQEESSGNSPKGVELCSHREGEVERPMYSRCDSEELVLVESSSESAISHLRSRGPRVPKPPPRPSSSSSSSSSSLSSYISSSPGFTCNEADKNDTTHQIGEATQTPAPFTTLAPSSLPHTVKLLPAPPPLPSRHSHTNAVPPPPPPPPRGTRGMPAKVRRVPEVVEFYHSLMRRGSRRDSGGGVMEAMSTANARDMIGEIENRSAHLLAIKTDVETQGEFIGFLIKEVENAAFTNIEDVVRFVKWLDDELSYLVDERAVLKHFNWPEHKADALREAAFGYCDLKKLEAEASSFRDDPRQPSGPALKKMQALFEKLEHRVYNLSRMRESATKRYKVFQIPLDWMLDSGYVSQIKLASVKLAMKYMKRVSAELGTVGGGPEEEELILQGVRFAFRAHQFAGGFDVETMKAFQELRDKARSCHVQCQNQQDKLICRETPC